MLRILDQLYVQSRLVPCRNNDRTGKVSVNERIEEQLKSHDILLYMKGTPDFPQCGFSGQAVAALKQIGKPFAYFNIFEDEEIRQRSIPTGRRFPSYTSGASLSAVRILSSKCTTPVNSRSS